MFRVRIVPLIMEQLVLVVLYCITLLVVFGQDDYNKK